MLSTSHFFYIKKMRCKRARCDISFTTHPSMPRVAALIMVALSPVGLVRSLSRSTSAAHNFAHVTAGSKPLLPRIEITPWGFPRTSLCRRNHPPFSVSRSLQSGYIKKKGLFPTARKDSRLAGIILCRFFLRKTKGPDYLWLISSTRQITPPTKNGHAILRREMIKTKKTKERKKKKVPRHQIGQNKKNCQRHHGRRVASQDRRRGPLFPLFFPFTFFVFFSLHLALPTLTFASD